MQWHIGKLPAITRGLCDLKCTGLVKVLTCPDAKPFEQMLILGSHGSRKKAYAANVLPVIREIRRAGVTSLHQIAAALNARGINAPRGGRWYAKSVSNVLARA
jgi:Recombinase